MWKFSGQDSNLHHSCNQNHCSDNVRSLPARPPGNSLLCFHFSLSSHALLCVLLSLPCSLSPPPLSLSLSLSHTHTHTHTLKTGSVGFQNPLRNWGRWEGGQTKSRHCYFNLVNLSLIYRWTVGTHPLRIIYMQQSSINEACYYHVLFDAIAQISNLRSASIFISLTITPWLL